MDIRHHTTDALAIKGSTALAIVLSGIATSNALYEKYESIATEEKKLGNHFPANYFERAASEQYDVYYKLLETMPYLPASDLIEAAAQVGQAMTVINMAYDELPDNDEVNRTFKKMEKQVAFLAYSAIRAIEKIGGFSLAEMGLSGIRGSNLDPWADVENVVDQIRKEGVK